MEKELREEKSGDPSTSAEERYIVTLGNSMIKHINPFIPIATFLYSLKTSENLTIFCFHEVEKGCIGNEWVNNYEASKKLETLQGLHRSFSGSG